MVWVGKGLKDHPVPTHCHGQGCHSLLGGSGFHPKFSVKEMAEELVCLLADMEATMTQVFLPSISLQTINQADKDCVSEDKMQFV